MSCISPFLKRQDRMSNDDFNYIKLPCGKCYECLKLKAQQWAFRFKNEMLRCNVYTPLFVTLTYQDKFLKYTENGLETLYKPDLQAFVRELRRLEKAQGNKLKIVYYGCGEYGSETYRPHYHICLLNVRNKTNIERAWSHGTFSHMEGNSKMFDYEPYGGIHVGIAQDASIAYTMKYMQKSIGIMWHEDDDRRPEFAIMSKKIGDNYVFDYQNITYHQLNEFITLEGGVKMPMPRYYRDKMYTVDERRRFTSLQMKLHQATEAEKRAAYERDNPGYTYDWIDSIRVVRKIQAIDLLYKRNRNKV